MDVPLRKVVSLLELQRTDSSSVGLGWGLGACVFKMLPGDAADLETTLSKEMRSSKEGGDRLQISTFLQL